MKDYGILFSGPMVLALRNTRIGSWPPEPIDPTKPCKGVTRRLSKQWLKRKKGDVLWVREAWGIGYGAGILIDPCINYRADGGQCPLHHHKDSMQGLWYPAGSSLGVSNDWLLDSKDGWHPSIHMPRWACRIRVELMEDPREERLQDITEEDAQLEGVEPWLEADLQPDGELREGPSIAYRASFHDLWAALHTKPGERWEDNPELVRVGPFRRVDVLR